MNVMPVEIVRAHFERELPRALECARTLGWDLSDDRESLTVRAHYTALDGERFILCGTFDDYKAKPPFLEFEDPDTGQLGTMHAYPKGHDSFFHSKGPCICAPFSRKAYKDVHPKWRCEDWTTSTENKVRWAQYSTMAGMLSIIYTRISHPAYYKGRMA